MIFPGVTLKKKFDGSLEGAWGPTLIILMYNIGDTVGKFCIKYKNLYSYDSVKFLVFGRFWFYFSTILIASNTDDSIMNSDTFAFIN